MKTKATILRHTKMHAFIRPTPSCVAFALPPGAYLPVAYDDNATFIPALAHEVRNPLSTINLAVEMLNLGTLDEEQQQFLDIIARGSRRITELINRLLVSTKAEAATSELYSLSQLLDEVLFMARDRILLKHITVRKDYAETQHNVLMDKEKMKIALSNIITNAIDAMPTEEGELNLVMKSNGGQNTIEIRDNGVGISKEQLQNIFKPYFTNKPGGLGLGLSVTLDILRANNASVDVRSAEGAGTCFRLSFDKIERQPGLISVNIGQVAHQRFTGPPALNAAYSSAI
jgi:signal transduction histidine kinase